jgi:predicted nuclease of predicted toxin-antitoxin system
VSQDTDFTSLLYYRKASGPSLSLLRNLPDVTAAQVAELIMVNLPQLEDALGKGAAVSIVGDRIRVRRLPLR